MKPKLISLDDINKAKPARIFDVVNPRVFRYDTHQVYNAVIGSGFINSGRDYEYYYALGVLIQPQSVFEIGVRYGYSAISLLLGALSANKRPVRYNGWDNEEYERMSNAIAADSMELVGIKNAQISRINSQTQSAIGGVFDLIHVDGDHSYSGAKHDINLVHRNAKYLLIDDYGFPEVKRAVDEFHFENTLVIPTTSQLLLVVNSDDKF